MVARIINCCSIDPTDHIEVSYVTSTPNCYTYHISLLNKKLQNTVAVEWLAESNKIICTKYLYTSIVFLSIASRVHYKFIIQSVLNGDS